jgi:spermidine synthase
MRVRAAASTTAGGSRLTLLWLVFSSGVAVMGLEMTASQLIKPFFGSTISVWTSLIGLVMIFLTAGYYLGGAVADRAPSRGVLGGIVLAAGLVVLVLPLLSQPVLRAAWSLTPRAGLLVSSLIGTFALFCVPNVLLGCVCPFAMKLDIKDLARTGRAAGNLYAISAVGSVVGTFLPALVLIDRFGVRHTIMLFGALLVLAALLLLGRVRYLPAAGALGVLALPLSPMLPVKGLVAEKESPYNYVQVVGMSADAGKTAHLLIVDWGSFSSYVPGEFVTEEYYDYLLLAPLLRAEPPKEWLHRALIVGLAAGTVAKQITEAYGPVAIDGVEIDPAIVDFGRRYFDMNEPNLHVYATDGRAFLAGAKETYDWVIVDAYQGSDIPSHLVTKEYFQELRAHMSKQGVLALNLCWWEPGQTELMDRIASTVHTVFPHVYAITGISEKSGAVLLAGGAEVSPEQLQAHAAAVGHAGLVEIAGTLSAEKGPRLTTPNVTAAPLTDDKGLLTALVDRMYRKARQQQYDKERGALVQ